VFIEGPDPFQRGEGKKKGEFFPGSSPFLGGKKTPGEGKKTVKKRRKKGGGPGGIVQSVKKKKPFLHRHFTRKEKKRKNETTTGKERDRWRPGEKEEGGEGGERGERKPYFSKRGKEERGAPGKPGVFRQKSTPREKGGNEPSGLQGGLGRPRTSKKGKKNPKAGVPSPGKEEKGRCQVKLLGNGERNTQGHEKKRKNVK